MMRSPSAQEHLAFLVKLQRLLTEGDFTATYKFALLMALTDIAVEKGHDDLRPLAISMHEIAQKFIDYYWQQTMPYRVTGQMGEFSGAGVISQSFGSTAKIIKDICAFRQAENLDSLERAKRSTGYRRLLSAVAQTVAKQPVTYFQNIAGQSDPFVFERSAKGLTLKPGVASHLRKFHGLIQSMVQDRWVRHIKRNRRNAAILGHKDDLHGFLFETSRNTLQLVGAELSKLFGQRCFYCASRINGTPDVDHFIARALYGVDIAQNLVLAHPSCNRSKSDLLAARAHVGRWLEQITKHDDDVQQIALDTGVRSDSQTIVAVAQWSYQQGFEAGAHAWVAKGRFEAVDQEYLALF